MFAAYAGNLLKNLMESGFDLIERKGTSGVVDESMDFAVLMNTSQGIWYAFIIVNTDIVKFEQFVGINKYSDEFLINVKNEFNVRNLIAVNLLVGDADDKYREFLNEDRFSHDAPVTNVYWTVNPDKKEFSAAKNNPDKVSNLKEIVLNSLEPEENEQDAGADIGEIKRIYERAIEKRPALKVKSSACYVTYALIIINLLVTCIMELNGGSSNTENLIKYGAIVPSLIFEGQFYRLFTAMFIHIGLLHLAYNLFALYVFGMRAEKYLGGVKFTLIYILSGLVASLFSLLFTRSISAGASGAIYGIVGAVFVMTKKSGKSVDGLNLQTMMAYIRVGLLLGLLRQGVDNFAHLGGLVAGVIITMIIYKPELTNDDKYKGN